jgi:hypothetical protein
MQLPKAILIQLCGGLIRCWDHYVLCVNNKKHKEAKKKKNQKHKEYSAKAAEYCGNYQSTAESLLIRI